MAMERLDKIISRQLNITRSQAKDLIKKGCVAVNGAAAKAADLKCGDNDSITVNSLPVANNRLVYIMMNKPKGVISASEGKNEKTVIDLVPKQMRRRGLFPAGRLDKDTTGFVLLTDDGEFAHDILSPKKHINKTYIATLDKPFDDALVKDFEQGMTLGEEKLLSAEVEPLNGEHTVAKVVLKQGLYHQVKRMFKKHGITVVELKRIAMGNLPLDDKLAPGECRFLTEQEILLIKERP